MITETSPGCSIKATDTVISWDSLTRKKLEKTGRLELYQHVVVTP